MQQNRIVNHNQEIGTGEGRHQRVELRRIVEKYILTLLQYEDYVCVQMILMWLGVNSKFLVQQKRKSEFAKI